MVFLKDPEVCKIAKSMTISPEKKNDVVDVLCTYTLEIQVGSKLVKTWLHRKTPLYHPHYYSIKEGKTLSRSEDWIVRIQHCYLEVNCVVDWLALRNFIG